MAERKFGFAVAGLVFILDQLTKWVVTGPLGINATANSGSLPSFNLKPRISHLTRPVPANRRRQCGADRADGAIAAGSLVDRPEKHVSTRPQGW